MSVVVISTLWKIVEFLGGWKNQVTAPWKIVDFDVLMIYNSHPDKHI